MPRTSTRKSLGEIRADSVFSTRGMLLASGLCQQKISQARRWGINCKRFFVGRRAFYKGSDIQIFLEQLAAEEIRRACADLNGE